MSSTPYCRITAFACGAGLDSWWEGLKRKLRPAKSSRKACKRNEDGDGSMVLTFDLPRW